MEEQMGGWMCRQRGALTGTCMLKQWLPCPHDFANMTYLKGYNGVKQQHTQAAHEPGQVVQQVAALALAHLRVLEQHAQPVQRVPQHHQRKQ